MTLVDALIPLSIGVRRVPAEQVRIGPRDCLVHPYLQSQRLPPPVPAPDTIHRFTVADARTGFLIASGRDRRAAQAEAARVIARIDPEPFERSVQRAVEDLRGRGGDYALIGEVGPVEAARMTAVDRSVR